MEYIWMGYGTRLLLCMAINGPVMSTEENVISSDFISYTECYLFLLWCDSSGHRPCSL